VSAWGRFFLNSLGCFYANEHNGGHLNLPVKKEKGQIFQTLEVASRDGLAFFQSSERSGLICSRLWNRLVS
jgi:hypothetical protein